MRLAATPGLTRAFLAARDLAAVPADEPRSTPDCGRRGRGGAGAARRFADGAGRRRALDPAEVRDLYRARRAAVRGQPRAAAREVPARPASRCSSARWSATSATRRRSRSSPARRGTPPAQRRPPTTRRRTRSEAGNHAGRARGLRLGAGPRPAALPCAGRVQRRRPARGRGGARRDASWTCTAPSPRASAHGPDRRIAAARARAPEPRRLLPAGRCVLRRAVVAQRAAAAGRRPTSRRGGARGDAGERHRPLPRRLQGAAHQGRLAVQRRPQPPRRCPPPASRGRAPRAGALSRAHFLARGAGSRCGVITRRSGRRAPATRT